MKKILSKAAAVMLLSSLTIIPVSDAQTSVSVSSHNIFVNGNRVNPTVYNINGNNYFKLRDIAYCLNGTENQFEVNWSEENNCINIATGYSYTPTGSENSGAYIGKGMSVNPSTANVTVNNLPVFCTAYNVNNNNYYKLRDLADALGFNVSWSDESDSVFIDTTPNGSTTGNSDTAVSDYSSYINEVVSLVNAARAEKGLSALTSDESLNNAAAVRADELNNLFSHTRPDGRNCFSVLKDMGISYRTAAENIAIGQKTPQAVVNSWLSSPGHYANIMNENVTKIGVGVTKTNSGKYSGYAWVQLFTN